MKREKCLLMSIYGQTLGQSLMEKVSLEIHNSNTTSAISLTSFHLWFNPGPSFFHLSYTISLRGLLPLLCALPLAPLTINGHNS
jgi:hypothetical protein